MHAKGSEEFTGLKLVRPEFKTEAAKSAFIDGLKSAQWLKVLEVAFCDDLLPVFSDKEVKARLEKAVIGLRTQKQIDHVISFLAYNSKVQEFNLKYLCCEDAMGRELTDALLSVENLKSLGFAHCQFVESDWDFIFRTISRMQIEKFRLRHARGKEAFPLEKWSSYFTLPSIKELNIGRNNLAELDPSSSTGVFSGPFFGLNSVEILHLDGCHLEDPSFLKMLSKGFPVLNELNLSDNELTNESNELPRIFDELLSRGVSLRFSGKERFWQDLFLRAYLDMQAEFKHKGKFCFDAHPSLQSFWQMPVQPLSGQFSSVLPRVSTFSGYTERFSMADDRQKLADLLEQIKLAPRLTQVLYDESAKFVAGDAVFSAKARTEAFLACVLASGFEKIEIPRDGRCLFAAVAQGLSFFGEEIDVEELREKTLCHMEEHEELYASSFGEVDDLTLFYGSAYYMDGISEEDIAAALANPELMAEIRTSSGLSLKARIEAMRSDPHMHGDQYEVEALSRMKGVKIQIMSRDYSYKIVDGKFTNGPIHGAERDGLIIQPTIYLYLEENHYDLLVPQNNIIIDEVIDD
jgi:hypothetical protein